jgi:hypothetical protein
MGCDALGGFVQSTNVACSDSGELSSHWALQIDDTPPSNTLGEGAPCLLLDLLPCGVRDRGEFSMQVVHDLLLLFRLPISREPLLVAARGSLAGASACGA